MLGRCLSSRAFHRTSMRVVSPARRHPSVCSPTPGTFLLQKPFDLADYLVAVRRLLDRHVPTARVAAAT
jgi:hypothetical protein